MKERSVLVDSVSTDAISSDNTIIYTVPNNTRAKWLMGFISNSTGSTVSNVTMNIVDGVDIPILGSKSLPSGDFVMFDSNSGYVMLEAGYKVKVRADSTGVSCILTLEETTGLVSTN